MSEPPEGWSPFGTHIYQRVRLEFSEEEDEAGMPLWERPLQGAVLSTWTIFFNTSDHPGRYVVRRFDVMQGRAEPVPALMASLHSTLEAARADVPPSADTCFMRSPEDDPTIVETWM